MWCMPSLVWVPLSRSFVFWSIEDDESGFCCGWVGSFVHSFVRLFLHSFVRSEDSDRFTHDDDLHYGFWVLYGVRSGKAGGSRGRQEGVAEGKRKSG